jgi:hypothetical protein
MGIGDRGMRIRPKTQSTIPIPTKIKKYFIKR